MESRIRFTTLAILAAAFGVTFASAQTLYKLIDKDGKVTYSEAKPKEFDGQVIPLNIDPNANTASFPKPAPGAGASGESSPFRGRKDAPKLSPEERLAQAQDRLDKAKAALQQAQDNPGPDDVMMVGKVGGGVRNIPTEAYTRKLEKLQQDVKDAEDNLTSVEKG